MVWKILNRGFCMLYRHHGSRVPSTWDFFRLQFDLESRVFLNSVTYFVAYFSFVAWFVSFILRQLKARTRTEHLEKCDCIVAVILSLVTAIKLLWPALMLLTYFTTCSYYPWATCLAIVYMSTWELVNSAVFTYLVDFDAKQRIRNIVQHTRSLVDTVKTRLSSDLYELWVEHSSDHLFDREYSDSLEFLSFEESSWSSFDDGAGSPSSSKSGVPPDGLKGTVWDSTVQGDDVDIPFRFKEKGPASA